MDISLRQATEDDFEFVFQLNKTNMKQYVDKMRGRDEQEEREDMKTKFTPGVDQVVMVDDMGVGIRRVIENVQEIHIDHIELLPERQGKGIGSRLIQGLTLQAQASGKDVTLTVLKENPAVNFYQRHGFEIVGESGIKLMMKMKINS